jgi:hypothetical protein
MWTEPETPDAWERWVRATGLHHFGADHYWLWPMSETLHYLGLSLLLGTVGLFDLRVLGMAKAIPPSALHKLIPLGIAGYCVNILTGIAFFSGFPEQYAYNPSSFWKGGVHGSGRDECRGLLPLQRLCGGQSHAGRERHALSREIDRRHVAGRLGRGLDLRAAPDLLQAADFPLIGPRG